MVTRSLARVAAMASIMAMRWSLQPETVPPESQSHAPDNQVIRALGDLCSQPVQLGGDGVQPVALLEPQPGGSHDAGGLSVPQSRP